MSEINDVAVFTDSSRQLLSLANSLKHHPGHLQNKVVDSLLYKCDVGKREQRKINHRFSRHPDHLSLDSDDSAEPFTKVYTFQQNCNINSLQNDNSVLSINFTKPSKPASPKDSSNLLTEITRSLDMEPVEAIMNCQFVKKVVEHNDAPNTNQNVDNSMVELFKKDKIDIPHEPAVKNVTPRVNTADIKLREYLQRIISYLEDIKKTMAKGFEPPDGIEDWERARVRTTEFAVRFSRNYVYQVGREVSELEDLTKSSGRLTSRTTRNIHQRLLSAHQVISQALQAYRSHMCTLLANALAEKLQYVVEQTSVLCRIHFKYFSLVQTGSSKRENLIHCLTERCEIMLCKIEEIIEKRGTMKNISYIPAPATKLSLMGYKMDAKKPGKPKLRKKSALEARFSMYSIPTGIRNKDAGWKKTVEVLANDRFKYANVASRYRTSGFKHRQPLEKPTTIDLPTKSKLLNKRSSCLLRNTPVITPGNEDEIVTLVEMQRTADINAYNAVAGIENQIPENTVSDLQIETLTPLIQGIYQQVCPKDAEAMTQKQLEIVLKGILGMSLDEKINGNNETRSQKNGFTPHTKESIEKEHKSNADLAVLKLKDTEIFKSETVMLDKIEISAVHDESKHNVQFHDHNINDLKNSGEQRNRSKKKLVVSVSGAKNAQLICIRDENSIIESPTARNESIGGNIEEEAKEVNDVKKHKGLESNGIICKNKNNNSEVRVNKTSKATIKISRLPKKALKQLVLMPKQEVYNVIQYKLQYNKFAKQNHMYRKSSKVQPWTIVDIVSEHLLNDLLLLISKEIQVDKILETLYQSEFQ